MAKKILNWFICSNCPWKKH